MFVDAVHGKENFPQTKKTNCVNMFSTDDKEHVLVYGLVSIKTLKER